MLTALHSTHGSRTQQQQQQQQTAALPAALPLGGPSSGSGGIPGGGLVLEMLPQPAAAPTAPAPPQQSLPVLLSGLPPAPALQLQPSVPPAGTYAVHWRGALVVRAHLQYHLRVPSLAACARGPCIIACCYAGGMATTTLDISALLSAIQHGGAPLPPPPPPPAPFAPQ